ncbi:hypothetical protein FQV18_0011249, partial [Eudyptula minor novaehollandiae]
WPSVDPSWDYNNANGRAACETACHNLVLAIKAAGQTAVNWERVREARQRSEEHPSDFWSCLRQALLRYGGMTEGDLNDKLAVSVFVQQAAPDIHEYFVKHAPGWQGGKNPQKILSPAAYVYDGR